MNWINDSNKKKHPSRPLKYINHDIERVEMAIGTETVYLNEVGYWKCTKMIVCW